MNHKNGNCEKCQHKMCVRRVPIFKELSFDELSRVADLIIRRKYAKGEMVILEGSALNSLIIINHGQVKAFRYNQEGKEQILYIFSEGDFLGEKNLLTLQEATYNVEALEETHICMINKEDFQRLLSEFSDISFKIISELCARIERLENTIQGMGTKNIEARVSAVLLEFAKRYGRQDTRGILVELPLSREGIANYIGVVRETVSRKMSRLQDEGIIDMVGNKKIIILNKEALEREIE